MLYLLRTILFSSTLLTLLLIGCAPDKITPEEEIQALLKSGNKTDAAAKIRLLLQSKNKEQSLLLSGLNNPRRKLKRSLNGTSIAWIEGPLLFYSSGRTFEKLKLEPKQGHPVNFNISPSGNSVVLSLLSDKTCYLHVVFLPDKEFMNEEGIPADCRHTPAFTDKNRTLFFIQNNEFFKAIIDEDGEVKTEKLPLKAANFKAPYKKIPQGFQLLGLTPNTSLIYYGAAGYYQVFSYNLLTHKLKRLGKGYSKANLFGITDEFHLMPADKNQKPAVTLPLPNPQPVAAAYIYSGGAGRYKSHPVYAHPEIKLGSGKPIQYSPSLTFVTKENAFLVVRKKLLAFKQSKNSDYRYLPLQLKQFELFTEGIVYTDSNNHLYFRRAHFTPQEINLLKLLKDTKKM